MSNTRNTDTVVGIDFGQAYMKCVEIQQSPLSAAVVMAYGHILTAQQSPDSVSGQLRELAQTARIKAKNARVLIDSRLAIVKLYYNITNIDATKSEFVKDAFKEIKQSDYYISHQIIPGPQNQAVIAAVPKEYVNYVKKIVRKAGFAVEHVTIPVSLPLSIESGKLVESQPLLLDWGYNKTELFYMHEDSIKGYKYSHFGYSYFRERMLSDTKEKPKLIEKELRKFLIEGPSDISGDLIGEAFLYQLKEFASFVKSYADSMKDKYAVDAGAVTVTGGLGCYPRLLSYLSHITKMKCTALRTSEGSMDFKIQFPFYANAYIIAQSAGNIAF